MPDYPKGYTPPDAHKASEAAAAMSLQHEDARDDALSALDHSGEGDHDDAAKSHRAAASAHEKSAQASWKAGNPKKAQANWDAAAAHRSAAGMHSSAPNSSDMDEYLAANAAKKGKPKVYDFDQEDDSDMSSSSDSSDTTDNAFDPHGLLRCNDGRQGGLAYNFNDEPPYNPYADSGLVNNSATCNLATDSFDSSMVPNTLGRIVPQRRREMVANAARRAAQADSLMGDSARRYMDANPASKPDLSGSPSWAPSFAERRGTGAMGGVQYGQFAGAGSPFGGAADEDGSEMSESDQADEQARRLGPMPTADSVGRLPDGRYVVALTSEQMDQLEADPRDAGSSASDVESVTGDFDPSQHERTPMQVYGRNKVTGNARPVYRGAPSLDDPNIIDGR